MFQQLSERLQGIFRRLKSQGHLTEVAIQEGLREVRLATAGGTGNRPSDTASRMDLGRAMGEKSRPWGRPP